MLSFYFPGISYSPRTPKVLVPPYPEGPFSCGPTPSNEVEPHSAPTSAGSVRKDGYWQASRAGETVRRNFRDLGILRNLSQSKQVRKTLAGIWRRSSWDNLGHKLADWLRERGLLSLVAGLGPKGRTGNSRTPRTIQKGFLAQNVARFPRSRSDGSAGGEFRTRGPETQPIRHLPRAEPTEEKTSELNHHLLRVGRVPSGHSGVSPANLAWQFAPGCIPRSRN